jgi:integrase
MWTGRSTHPRSRPRAQQTVQIKLRWAMPILRAWAATGIESLREVSREHVLAALPPAGNPRYTAGAGLRAIFKLLKAHKVVFVDPTAGVKLGAPETRMPLPGDLAIIREGLRSTDSTRAAMTALLAFHGVRVGQIRHLQLTDIRDGRLYLPTHTVLLAKPVRVRLAAYLDYRNQRWPRTANPHLFIHHRTATGVKPVGPRWPQLALGTAAGIIRVDRIVDEVLATGGDLRRIYDLFGMSIAGAKHYTAVLNHPDLTDAVHR